MMKIEIRRYDRGQALISDFVISITIFMTLLILIHLAWSNNIADMGNELERQRAMQAAHKGMDSIVLSPGFPSNWAVSALTPDQAELKGIGIAQSQGSTDEVKAARLKHYSMTQFIIMQPLRKWGLDHMMQI